MKGSNKRWRGSCNSVESHPFIKEDINGQSLTEADMATSQGCPFLPPGHNTRESHYYMWNAISKSNGSLGLRNARNPRRRCGEAKNSGTGKKEGVRGRIRHMKGPRASTLISRVSVKLRNERDIAFNPTKIFKACAST